MIFSENRFPLFPDHALIAICRAIEDRASRLVRRAWIIQRDGALALADNTPCPTITDDLLPMMTLDAARSGSIASRRAR
jgi:hypothetical protein